MGSPSHLRFDALDLGRLGIDRIVESKRPVKDAAGNLSSIRHLTEGRRLDCRCLRGDHLGGGVAVAAAVGRGEDLAIAVVGQALPGRVVREPLQLVDLPVREKATAEEPQFRMSITVTARDPHVADRTPVTIVPSHITVLGKRSPSLIDRLAGFLSQRRQPS